MKTRTEVVDTNRSYAELYSAYFENRAAVTVAELYDTRGHFEGPTAYLERHEDRYFVLSHQWMPTNEPGGQQWVFRWNKVDGREKPLQLIRLVVPTA